MPPGGLPGGQAFGAKGLGPVPRIIIAFSEGWTLGGAPLLKVTLILSGNLLSDISIFWVFRLCIYNIMCCCSMPTRRYVGRSWIIKVGVNYY